MIIKIVTGDYAQYIETDNFVRQRLHNGNWDLDCCKDGRSVGRFIVGSEPLEHSSLEMSGEAAYIMDHGKTVDVLR